MRIKTTNLTLFCGNVLQRHVKSRIWSKARSSLLFKSLAQHFSAKTERHALRDFLTTGIIYKPHPTESETKVRGTLQKYPVQNKINRILKGDETDCKRWLRELVLRDKANKAALKAIRLAEQLAESLVKVRRLDKDLLTVSDAPSLYGLPISVLKPSKELTEVLEILGIEIIDDLVRYYETVSMHLGKKSPLQIELETLAKRAGAIGPNVHPKLRDSAFSELTNSILNQ